MRLRTCAVRSAPRSSASCWSWSALAPKRRPRTACPTGPGPSPPATPAPPPGVALGHAGREVRRGGLGRLEGPSRAEADPATARLLRPDPAGSRLRLAGRMEDARRDTLAGAVGASPEGPWAARSSARSWRGGPGRHPGGRRRPRQLARAEAASRSWPTAARRPPGRGRPLVRPPPARDRRPPRPPRPRGRPRAARPGPDAGPGRDAPLPPPVRGRPRQPGGGPGLPGRSTSSTEGYLKEYPRGDDRDAARLLLGESRRVAGQLTEARLPWSDLARDPGTRADFRARSLYLIARTYGKPPEAPQAPVGRPFGGFPGESTPAAPRWSGQSEAEKEPMLAPPRTTATSPSRRRRPPAVG